MVNMYLLLPLHEERGHGKLGSMGNKCFSQNVTVQQVAKHQSLPCKAILLYEVLRMFKKDPLI